MKPIPDVPALSAINRLPAGRTEAVIAVVAQLKDEHYLHWDRLRHRPSPQGLSPLEWWLALKLRRAGARMLYPELRATDGTELGITRHAKLDAGFAHMDRQLADRVAMPEDARNQATRDQYIASSLMEEAIHSSLFEGAVSTREEAKDMLRSERAPTSRDERMILNNYRAMQRIREMAREALSIDGVMELHSILTEGTLDRPECAGRIQRPGETRVHIIDDRINRVVFTPPPAETLPDRMERLVEFANADDIDGDRYVHPVLRSILLHFQLAYDHPFYDGNGRTARALFYWSMLRRGYWLAEYLSISRLLYRQRQPYQLAFQYVESDGQDATYFVIQQLDVLRTAVDELYAYVERKSQAQAAMRRRLVNRGDFNHRQLALLDHAMRRPQAEYTHESHANSHRVSDMTARNDLLGLVERGLLTKHRSGKRRLIYCPAPDLDAMLHSGH